MAKPNKFVFAVCGGGEHIDTLHFSLDYLRHFSDNEIIVVTDSTRNEKPIRHKNIVNVETPKEFNHHQASIFLKTSLNRILPEGPNYCYLDSDVVAVREGVDMIFMYKNGPVTFASDHCKMPFFSPSAVNCPCSLAHDPEEARILTQLIGDYSQPSEELKEKEKRLLATIEEYNQTVLPLTDAQLAARDELIELFRRGKRQPWKFPFILLFKILPKFRRKLNKSIWTDREGNVLLDQTKENNFKGFVESRLGFRWDKEKDVWYDEAGITLFPKVAEEVEKRSEFRWDQKDRQWVNAKGFPVFLHQCDHLREQIKAKFGVEVTQSNWQHWNGGVFLFDAESHDFLDNWHKWTLEAFEDPKWKTRDQGTLIATVWKMGLQDQGTLPIQFNFLADYFKQDLQFSKEQGFTLDNFKTAIQPYFAHIYHQWGNADWAVWQWVEEIGQSISKEETSINISPNPQKMSTKA